MSDPTATITKEEYEAYIHPVNKKTGKQLEVSEMTPKQANQHNKMMKYWVRYIQPYLCEKD